jgi:hypothetical protein
MKANELRIGNLVYDSSDLHILKIECIDNNKEGFNGYFIRSNNGSQISSLEDFEENEDDKFIQPIPLTEEWLVKFGFRQSYNEFYSKKILGDNNSVYQFIIRVNDSVFDFLIEENQIEIQEHNVICPRYIKYVHTLQNLYFALTNEELTINHPSAK